MVYTVEYYSWRLLPFMHSCICVYLYFIYIYVYLLYIYKHCFDHGRLPKAWYKLHEASGKEISFCLQLTTSCRGYQIVLC